MFYTSTAFCFLSTLCFIETPVLNLLFFSLIKAHLISQLFESESENFIFPLTFITCPSQFVIISSQLHANLPLELQIFHTDLII